MPSYMLSRNHFTLGKGLLWVALGTLSACNLFKAAPRDQQSLGQTPPPKPIPTTVVPPPKPTARLVDTVYWASDVLAAAPIATASVYEKPAAAATPSSYATVTSKAVSPKKGKFGYNVALLLPFYTHRLSDNSLTYSEKSQFALDFYAGVRLAADSLSARNVSLNVAVLDSKSDYNVVLNSTEMAQADFIIGPVERENLLQTLDFARLNDKILISPYVPLGDLDTNYAGYIQVKPSLQTHCEAIVKHIRLNYGTDQVVLVGREADSETARFAYFQEANAKIDGTTPTGKFEEWALEDETNLAFSPYILQKKQTVFVLPSWNEAFVGRFLEALNNSPYRGNVVVYGMPQWTDYKSLTPYYEPLKVRLSSSTFIETTQPEVKAFRTKFFGTYGKMPNADAFLGYDCMLYFGQLMGIYGLETPYKISQDVQPVLHTKFDFEPVLKSYTDPNTGEEQPVIVKFENKYINILKYQGGSFKLD